MYKYAACFLIFLLRLQFIIASLFFLSVNAIIIRARLGEKN